MTDAGLRADLSLARLPHPAPSPLFHVRREDGGVSTCPPGGVQAKDDGDMGTTPRTARLTGKDMRPDFYDELTPEEQAWWDALEYDESIIPAGNVAILGGGPRKPTKE